MEIKKIMDGDVFSLVDTNTSKSICAECVFNDKGQCLLRHHATSLAVEEEDELLKLCEVNPSMHWIYSGEVEEDKADACHNSSTGGESPNNNTPRVTKADVKRSITLELTLKEARGYYNSHNPILRDIACRLFTPAELEDVRRCTMNVDIKTAKRLYHNAENAVRDFVLSAFSKEELED